MLFCLDLNIKMTLHNQILLLKMQKKTPYFKYIIVLKSNISQSKHWKLHFPILITPGLISELPIDKVRHLDLSQVREISLADFTEALKRIRRSVPQDSLAKYVTWNQEYGDITV